MKDFSYSKYCNLIYNYSVARIGNIKCLHQTCCQYISFFSYKHKERYFFNKENHIAFQSSLITVAGATKLLFILSLVHYAFYNVLLLVTCVQSKREFFEKCKVYFRSFYITIECVSQRSNMKPIIAWGSDYERRM